MSMRQFPLSMKWLIVLSFLGFGLLLVGGYTLLSVHYFIRGMDNMLANHMQKAGEHFLAQQGAPLAPGYHQTKDYGVASHWDQLPERVRIAFPNRPSSYELHKNEGERFPPEVIQFLLPLDTEQGIIYITHSLSPQTASELMDNTIKASLDNLVLIGGGTAAILVFGLVLLTRRLFRPVSELRDWTRQLTPDKLAQPPPSFSYPELNELAQIIRSSLHSVQQSLEREHQFLRHTSHELRTPISTIRSNVELLHKLHEGTPANSAEQQVIQRLDRASTNMRDLTETLLWLSKDKVENLPVSNLALDQLIQHSVDDLRYLLNDKVVNLKVDLSPTTLSVPAAPLKIVLSNLIRNSFQHTWEGEVEIQQRGPEVFIYNRNLEPTDADQNTIPATTHPEDLGFGLGLKLTSQLCQKLGWSYHNEPHAQGHRVRLIIQ